MVIGEIKEKERKGVLRHGTRRTGAFEYRLRLPGEADAEKVTADMSASVLTVTVPKAEVTSPVTWIIEINESGGRARGHPEVADEYRAQVEARGVAQERLPGEKGQAQQRPARIALCRHPSDLPERGRRHMNRPDIDRGLRVSHTEERPGTRCRRDRTTLGGLLRSGELRGWWGGRMDPSRSRPFGRSGR